MKAVKSEIINKLMEIEHLAETGEDFCIDEVYHLTKTLHYVEKACEVIHKDGHHSKTEY